MNKLQNILFLLAIAFGSYGFPNGNTHTENQIPKENPTNSFSQEGLHLLVCIQPESIHHIVTNVKTGDHIFSGWPDHSNSTFTNFKSSNAHKFFNLQDINRCEKVSLLLFPFHIFW